MSSRERWTLVGATLVAALSRFLAVSATPWDWDEMLFAAALREYDVEEHQPHPPGFPLFIAAARVVKLAGVSDFHALQTIVVLCSLALFPLVFLLARSLEFDYMTALGGALVFVFAPNVWFYGGTAFSDVPALAVLLASCVLLLRGQGMAGAVMLGIAVGIRPQSLLVGIVPLFIGAGRDAPRLRARTPALVGIVLIIAGLSYVGAGVASGSVADFVQTVREQQQYVSRVDSYQNPGRPSLLSLTRTFFKPIRGTAAVDKVISILAFLGGGLVLVRRFRGGLLLAAMFVPLNLFSWLMLDVNASSRYAVSYAALYTILAVYALPARVKPAGIALILAVFLWRAWPALTEVRTRLAPPVAAMDWIAANVPHTATVYAFEGLKPFARYFLPEHNVQIIGRQPPRDARGYFVNDQPARTPCSVNFVRRWERLRHVARGRYFETSITPLGGC